MGRSRPRAFIDRAAHRSLSAMVARAGGVSIEPEIAVITVQARQQQRQVWLTDLYSNPETTSRCARRSDPGRGRSAQIYARGALGGQTACPWARDDQRGRGRWRCRGLSRTWPIPGRLHPARRARTGWPLGFWARRCKDRSARPMSELTRTNGCSGPRLLIRDEDTVYVTRRPMFSGKRAGALIGPINPQTRSRTCQLTCGGRTESRRQTGPAAFRINGGFGGRRACAAS